MAPCRVSRSILDFYVVRPGEAAWTLVALCEGDHERLLLTGRAHLPVAQSAYELTCTGVDAPNPLVLDGVPGVLRVTTSTLVVLIDQVGLGWVVGKVETEWTALRASAASLRSFTITVALDAQLRR